LSELDHFSCKRAAPVIVLSEDMKQTLSNRPNGSTYNIQVLNNFNLPIDLVGQANLPIKLNKESLNILFAGNIGRFQGLDIVIDTMTLLKERQDIKFIFIGEGSDKKRLNSLSKKKNLNIDYIEQQPLSIASSLMKEVDFGFVALTNNIYKFAYPSKTMMYLSQGCPLIVVAEPNSQLVRDISDSEAGIFVAQTDSGGLANKLIYLANNRAVISIMKDNAQRLYEKEFNIENILPKWTKLLSG
jgi:glycosyltransferase involved in cell wall biosynthesis